MILTVFSAGLTLVNAKHVYLCEPVVNASLEMQAISRVHRIGQDSPTNVWLFTISGTVEESIVRLSSQKRLEAIENTMHKKNENDDTVVSDEVFDASNSKLLEKSSDVKVDRRGKGEIVETDDLWKIFFDN